LGRAYFRGVFRFTPEQEAQLSRIATHDGMDIEHFVKEAALRLVETKRPAPQRDI
jgi:hypothetical protein